MRDCAREIWLQKCLCGMRRQLKRVPPRKRALTCDGPLGEFDLADVIAFARQGGDEPFQMLTVPGFAFNISD